jgi:uncharacterized protein (DUF1501 family)
MTLSRRTLLATGAAGLAAAGLGVHVAFNREHRPTTGRDILVVVFLRFGSDGLTMIAPADDGNYRDKRPTIAVTTSGERAGLPLGELDRVPFFLHPSAPEIKALYDAGDLAIVHATGLPTNTRSHFESQDMLERGVTENDGPLAGGWLTRHLISRGLALPDLSVVASATDLQASLHGYSAAVAIPDVTAFNVTGGDFNLNVIEALNAGPEAHAAGVRGTVAMIRAVRAKLKQVSGYSTSAAYPTGGFGQAMRSVANLIKMNAGLEIATVDFGGWDHHYKMNQYFPGHAAQMSQTLAAFWSDMKDHRARLTVVTMTEFGRRLEENTAGGTDHGAASYMMVLGGAVKGGRLYGTWPGLRPSDLREGDLRITTDIRQVLAEILNQRRGEAQLARIFPTLIPTPLGLLKDA